MSTTANPVFIASNFMRDLQTAYVNLSDMELAGVARAAAGGDVALQQTVPETVAD
jgi:hypothetical protein